MDEKPRRTIDHKWTNQIPVGFCFNNTHKGYLTLKMMRQHECLRKQCRYLKKIPCEYWGERDQIKLLKQSRKLRLKG